MTVLTKICNTLRAGRNLRTYILTSFFGPPPLLRQITNYLEENANSMILIIIRRTLPIKKKSSSKNDCNTFFYKVISLFGSRHLTTIFNVKQLFFDKKLFVLCMIEEFKKNATTLCNGLNW